ncbi:MAG: response regulator, partial [Oscillospiraceae bacterium]
MELKVLVIDEDARSLKNIERICKGIQGISSVVSFGSPVLALDYIEENFHDVQVVFTEIEMSEMTGIELASRIHEISEDIRVVFATLAPQYALRAFEVDAVGYLLKPVDPVQIEKQILKLV